MAPDSDWNDCGKCMNMSICYPMLPDDPEEAETKTTVDFFNAITKRDLCVNNAKRGFMNKVS